MNVELSEQEEKICVCGFRLKKKEFKLFGVYLVVGFPKYIFYLTTVLHKIKAQNLRLTITIFEMFILDFKCQHCQLLQPVVSIGFVPCEAVTAVNRLTGD